MSAQHNSIINEVIASLRGILGEKEQEIARLRDLAEQALNERAELMRQLAEAEREAAERTEAIGRVHDALGEARESDDLTAGDGVRLHIEGERELSRRLDAALAKLAKAEAALKAIRSMEGLYLGIYKRIDKALAADAEPRAKYKDIGKNLPGDDGAEPGAK